MLPLKVLVGIPCAAVIGLQPANRIVESLLHHGYTKAGFIEISMPLDHVTDQPVETVEPTPVETQSQPEGFDLTDPVVGMDIAGYKVTSLQGPRLHPVHGTWRNHNGLDLGTPTGTPLFANGDIEVTCHYDSGGGGYFAQWEHAGMLWQALHLKPNTCKPGGYKPGWKFAETGSSGVGTAAHLHLQLRHPTERWFVKVKKGHVNSILVQQGGN